MDVTIVTEEEDFHCHKMVLSACSPYFKSLFEKTLDKHPVIVLHDVKSTLFAKILKYVYLGSVEVELEELQHFIRHATKLQIKYVLLSNTYTQF